MIKEESDNWYSAALEMRCPQGLVGSSPTSSATWDKVNLKLISMLNELKIHFASRKFINLLQCLISQKKKKKNQKILRGF